MVQAYNFLASWQLFPEKGTYDQGERPKSGIYKIDAIADTKELAIFHNWVTLENQAYASNYKILADGGLNDFASKEPGQYMMADKVQAIFPDGITFEIHFYKKGEVILHVVHEILPNGYLKITQQGYKEDGSAYTNAEVYHKQLSVLPYSASVSGAVIKPTEEGVIKHKALTAMEEQTNMQLDQIRKQIELLALQAHEIQQRKDLSLKIYNARLSFKPNIGQVYYLYEKHDDSFMLSLVSPKEWGKNGPFKKFIAGVQLLADHTWKEL
jgi:predicted transcriptional regulator